MLIKEGSIRSLAQYRHLQLPWNFITRHKRMGKNFFKGKPFRGLNY